MSGRPPADLCAEFTARVHAAIAQFGSEFEAAPVLAEYQDRGVSRASVFRWMAAARKSATSPAKAKAPAAKSAAKPAKPSTLPEIQQPRHVQTPGGGGAAVEAPPPPPVAVADIAARLPPVPRLEDARTMGVLPVLELLTGCIGHAQDLIKHARAPDGAVRNARLLMQASEHLRRAIETAARLNETVAIQRDMERFHEVCLEEIAQEVPAVQERILNRLRRAAIAALTDG